MLYLASFDAKVFIGLPKLLYGNFGHFVQTSNSCGCERALIQKDHPDADASPRHATPALDNREEGPARPCRFRKLGYGRPLCRHDDDPSCSIPVARQDRYVLHKSKCILTVRNGHGAKFLIAKSRRSRTNRGLLRQLRAGFGTGCPLCYHCWQSGDGIWGIPI